MQASNNPHIQKSAGIVDSISKKGGTMQQYPNRKKRGLLEKTCGKLCQNRYEPEGKFL